MWHLVWLGAAILCAAGSAFLFWRLYREHLRTHPVHLHLDQSPLSSGHRQYGLVVEGDGDNAVGKVGELITGLMLAHEGWRQLPSQPTGVHGIDGLFVRHQHNSGSYEILFVETKTSREGDGSKNYKNEQMSDARLIEQLEQLANPNHQFEGQAYIDHHVATALVHAIRNKSVWLSKRLYAHTLATGETLIYHIAANGALVRRPARAVQRVASDAHKYMFQALAIGLARLEQTGEFKGAGGVAMQNKAQDMAPVAEPTVEQREAA
jgi:hypothetical protein